MLPLSEGYEGTTGPPRFLASCGLKSLKAKSLEPMIQPKNTSEKELACIDDTKGVASKKTEKDAPSGVRTKNPPTDVSKMIVIAVRPSLGIYFSNRHSAYLSNQFSHFIQPDIYHYHYSLNITTAQNNQKSGKYHWLPVNVQHCIRGY